MRFIVRPLRDPESALDLTDAVIETIARQLSAACGGNAVLNRLEAAAHLESLLQRSASARESARALPTARTHPIEQSLEEEPHAVVDSSETHRDGQPQGFVVQRLSLERAG